MSAPIDAVDDSYTVRYRFVVVLPVYFRISSAAIEATTTENLSEHGEYCPHRKWCPCRRQGRQSRQRHETFATDIGHRSGFFAALDAQTAHSVNPTSFPLSASTSNITRNKGSTRNTTSATNTKRQPSEWMHQRIQSLGWRNRYSQDEDYPVTIANQIVKVRQVQRGEVEQTYGTGATVWPAAMVLLKYLERHSVTLRGRTVVDLGAGTGVTSIAAAFLGAKRVLCTDGEPTVVQLARENIVRTAESLSVLNTTTTAITVTTTDPMNVSVIQGCPVHTQHYWWGTGSIPDDWEVDVVLVADCVLPKLYPIAPLVQAIDQLLVKPNAEAILSYEHRYYPDYDPRDEFRTLAAARHLDVLVVPLTEHDHVYAVDDIEIWRVRRKTS